MKLGIIAALLLALTAVLVGAGGVIAEAGSHPATASVRANHDLARDLTEFDRSTVWRQVSRLDLDFPTYHPEGLVVTRDRIYLSSTEILEPTRLYTKPINGFDRTPGKGIGHLFVISRAGRLIEDIVLGHGIVYHPGGIDIEGQNLWVPVAQYRPFSSAEIDRVNVHTLKVSRLFAVGDHIGGIVFDRSTGHLVGNNWGSRTFYEWTTKGRQLARWRNPDDLVDFQDCEYVATAKMACGGITNLPQTPAAGGAAATYELGGIALLDLRRHRIINEVPFQQWSRAGHVMTRNPVKIFANGDSLTLWAAPDNGDEAEGTQLYTWQATVTARR